MSATELTASLFESLAWPAAVVLAVLLLKTPLSKLLEAIESIKAGGVELRMREQLSEAALRAPQVKSAPDAPSAGTGISELIDVHPRGAILEQWLEVEQLLAQLAEHHDVDTRIPRQSTMRIARELLRAEVFDDDYFFVIRQLAQVRNEAVHEHRWPISTEIAQQFVQLARRLVGGLEFLINPVHTDAKI